MFKVGDKVKRVKADEEEFFDDLLSMLTNNVFSSKPQYNVIYTIKEVAFGSSIVTLEELVGLWDHSIFDLTAKHINPHSSHTVVDNVALGKTFKYCKDCKVEV